MDNTEQKHREDENQPAKPVEHDYAHNQSDPGPAPQAVNEDDNKGAGLTMKWAIPIIIAILFLIYFFIFRK
jgi:hypothetical protein